MPYEDVILVVGRHAQTYHANEECINDSTSASFVNVKYKFELTCKNHEQKLMSNTKDEWHEMNEVAQRTSPLLDYIKSKVSEEVESFISVKQEHCFEI